MADKDYKVHGVKCPDCERNWTAALFEGTPEFDKPPKEMQCPDCKKKKAE